jgi:NADPH-dependent curcumin reductase CurA
MARLGKWVHSGKLKYREDIVDGGIAKAPEAFIGLLKGDNFGKRQVRVGAEPAGLIKS